MKELKLRPMDIGDILDSAFRLFKLNFAKFIHIMAPIYILYFITGAIYQRALVLLGATGGKSPAVFSPSIGIVGILFSVVFGLISTLFRYAAIGALVYSISGAYLGKDIVYKDAYKNIWSRFWPLIGVGTLCGLMTTIGFYMLFIPGVILTIFLSLVVPAMILEKKGVGESIGRSFELVAYSFWKAFLIVLIAYLIVGVASAISYLPFLIWGIIQGFSQRAPAQLPLSLNILYLAFNYAAQLFTAPFGMIATTLLYYDIRIRKEGFDLEIMARSLGYQVPQDKKVLP